MRNVFVLAADAYRMVDALRDYADILEAEATGLPRFTRATADRIENGKRAGGMIEVERFDLDAAHSAVIGVMCARREAAEALKAEVKMLEAQAKRLEGLLEAFTI